MIHVVWRHFILVPFTSFSQVPWSVLWLCHQFVTDVTAWLISPNLSCSKNRKRKEKKTENKIQEKEKIKTESTVHDFGNLPYILTIMAYVTAFLAYHKDHVYYTLLWYHLFRTFYILLCDFVTCDCVIWCDWCVTAWSCHPYPNPRFKK